jgi:hypothetical protein
MQRNLCPLRRSKGGNRGGYLCLWLPLLVTYASNLCPLRICQQSTFACCWVCKKRHKGSLARVAQAQAQPFLVAYHLLPLPRSIGLLTCQQSTFACCWVPLLSFDLRKQLMPGAHQQGRQQQQAAYAAAAGTRGGNLCLWVC